MTQQTQYSPEHDPRMRLPEQVYGRAAILRNAGIISRNSIATLLAEAGQLALSNPLNQLPSKLESTTKVPEINQQPTPVIDTENDQARRLRQLGDMVDEALSEVPEVVSEFLNRKDTLV